MTEIKKKIIQQIKSLYVMKEVFTFLNEKRKLNILIYNKNLQKIHEI